ncbi:MAG: putative porin [Pseudomonadales bacterium]|nr:putative porin [Pseudomonadales bacterium]
MKSVLTTALLGVLLLAGPGARAATTDSALIEALTTELAELRARLERLENNRKVPEVAYQTPATAVPAAGAGWEDRLRWKGDFRYRHETSDPEFSSKRHRQRIRARTSLEADLSDSLRVGFGLITGGQNPVSGNQTLGGGFSSKDIALDLSYVTWETPIDGLTWTAGKFRNPLHRAGDNGLLWDGDLRPEGTNVTFQRGGFSLTGLGLWASESSGKDIFVLGAQAGFEVPLSDTTRFLIGTGYYDLSDTRGRPVLFDGDPRGNSIDAAGNYLYGYEELEVFTELHFDIANMPTELFANWVQNLDADDYDTGYAIGASMRFGNGRQPWKVGYTYQDLEADAVLALFTDSDFMDGGTDGKGHTLKLGYILTSNVSLGGTLFINQRGGNLGEEEDFNRVLFDVQFKY